MIGMLSALFSAHALLTICFQPRSGMSVGFSALTPGSTCSLGASAGGRSTSGRGCVSVVACADWAAARRAAFSSTRSRIRSTALSRWLVPAMSSPWLESVSVGGGRVGAGRSVARPAPGELGEAAGSGPVDGRLRGREDGALQRGGQHDLAHLVLALQRARGVFLVGDLLPDLLEDDPGQGSGQDAADQADRPVGELRSLAHCRLLEVLTGFLLVPERFRVLERFRRHTTRPTVIATSASAAPSTTGGLSR